MHPDPTGSCCPHPPRAGVCENITQTDGLHQVRSRCVSSGFGQTHDTCPPSQLTVSRPEDPCALPVCPPPMTCSLSPRLCLGQHSTELGPRSEQPCHSGFLHSVTWGGVLCPGHLPTFQSGCFPINFESFLRLGYGPSADVSSANTSSQSVAHPLTFLRHHMFVY